MRKAGVVDSVIMEMTGHSTREMFFDRYNTIDKEDMFQGMEKTSSVRLGFCLPDALLIFDNLVPA